MTESAEDYATQGMTPACRDFAWAMKYTLEGCMVTHLSWGGEYWQLNEDQQRIVWRDGSEVHAQVFVTKTGFMLHELPKRELPKEEAAKPTIDELASVVEGLRVEALEYQRCLVRNFGIVSARTDRMEERLKTLEERPNQGQGVAYTDQTAARSMGLG